MQIRFIQYQGYTVLIFFLTVVSPFISRKFFWGSVYFFQLRNFTKLLSIEIKNQDDFKKIWSSYCKICSTDSHMRMLKGGIYLKYDILKLFCYLSLESLQIDAVTDGYETDMEYQENLLFWAFTYIVCDFASSYDIRKHSTITTELIREPLDQISFEPTLIQIIKDCHTDGKGFLSTLALMQSIMIYIRLPDTKKLLVSKFFEDISDLKIGWLSRRVFEVVIATVMIKHQPEEGLRELNIELRKAQIGDNRDKYNFRDEVLAKKLDDMGLEYADKP